MKKYIAIVALAMMIYLAFKTKLTYMHEPGVRRYLFVNPRGRMFPFASLQSDIQGNYVIIWPSDQFDLPFAIGYNPANLEPIFQRWKLRQ
jgi:hypothetical protein